MFWPETSQHLTLFPSLYVCLVPRFEHASYADWSISSVQICNISCVDFRIYYVYNVTFIQHTNSEIKNHRKSKSILCTNNPDNDINILVCHI